MRLYSKFADGSQFLGEKNDLKIQYLIDKILSKNPVLFLLGHPVQKTTFRTFSAHPVFCVYQRQVTLVLHFSLQILHHKKNHLKSLKQLMTTYSSHPSTISPTQSYRG